jgi:hypothetical protein
VNAIVSVGMLKHIIAAKSNYFGDKADLCVGQELHARKDTLRNSDLSPHPFSTSPASNATNLRTSQDSSFSLEQRT